MFSEIKIVNQVLNEISKKSVTNVDESADSQIIANKLKILLPDLLLKADWNFATKYVSNDTPLINNFSPAYQYTYLLPPDFGRMIKLFTSINRNSNLPWQIVDGRIQTNAKPLQYYYTVNNCDYSVIPAGFARALIMYCASKVAPALTENLMLCEALRDEYQECLNNAVVLNQQENPITSAPNEYNRNYYV